MIENKPDWSRHSTPEKRRLKYEQMKKECEDQKFWFAIFDFIYYFIWKPCSYVAMIYLVWCIWQFFESSK